MITLPFLSESFMGFAAIFVCIGFALLALGQSASNEVGPGYWTTGFFLNSAGFISWAGTVTSRPWLFFSAGEVLHMLGFITLVYGAYRFTGNVFQRRNIYVLIGFVVVWLGIMTMGLMTHHRPGSFFLLMVLRAVLFLWAGSMILRNISTKSVAGRRLAGWGLMAWGIYVLLFPFIWQWPWCLPLAFGFLVGFHVLAGMGMMILVVDRMRIRAETSEKHARHLEGLLPICSHCKKIRDKHDHWHRIETYIRERSDAEFSHGICPDCLNKFYGDEDWFIEMKTKKEGG
ncbi:hypothetical protein [Desulfobacula sp.]|uniref:hypothetical protein n=1 Tax=Desulfobacula sp. TaxID=2593537 RepID=UPI0026365741|nr:hypothetical protein [Desulfobacula sp.]